MSERIIRLQQVGVADVAVGDRIIDEADLEDVLDRLFPQVAAIEPTSDYEITVTFEGSVPGIVFETDDFNGPEYGGPVWKLVD